MMSYRFMIYFVLLFGYNEAILKELQEAHISKDLTSSELKYLARLGNTTDLNEILDHVCVPRVVGSPGHKRVANYIKSELQDLGWDVEEDSFKEKVPIFGELTFENIISTPNPRAERYLVLACHYDSKYFKEFEFIGATDSAVPCAMMLDLAKSMRKQLETTNDEVSLKLFFLDGEEAFERWNAQDSIYGARHLARLYENKKESTRSGHRINHLNRIDMFVLLDLLGASNPKFYSYFEETNKWYVKLPEIERRLRRQRLLSVPGKYFEEAFVQSYIEDDHLPFLRRGVPILHLIPARFPRFWHTIDDNRDIVDIATTNDLNKILRVFVAEYLHLLVDSS